MEKMMMPADGPLVSVIVPAYNCASFIGDAIQSVQRQTYSNWELLLVDDCSGDATREAAEAFAEQDGRIRVLVSSENQGAAEARNRGIEAARGIYLAFLDGDDVWEPEKLDIQVAFMQERDIAFSCTGYRVIDEEGQERGISICPPPEVNYSQLAGNTIIGCLTVMLDRRKIGEIRMPRVKPEDTALWLSLLRQGHKAYGIPQLLARYRIVQGSVSRNKLKAALRYWSLLRTQEQLPLLQAGSCFARYAMNAYWKSKRGRHV